MNNNNISKPFDVFSAPAWKILIADDEEQVRLVTQMTLNNYTYLGKPLDLLMASSAEQAKEIMANEQGVVIAMLDLVMETPTAGYEVAEYIRGALTNSLVRIVLRSGKGDAADLQARAERMRVTSIHEKVDLTARKLKLSVGLAIGAYCELALRDAILDELLEQHQNSDKRDELLEMLELANTAEVLRLEQLEQVFLRK